jgi:hypothetical protein
MRMRPAFHTLPHRSRAGLAPALQRTGRDATPCKIILFRVERRAQKLDQAAGIAAI